MNNFDPLYTGSRNDILSLIPDKVKKVLDVGCSVGALGESIKQRNGAEVVGIEMDKQMGEIASEKIDRVIVRDIEKVDLKAYFPLEYFDCIIFADILEHLRNPWGVLKNATNFLDKKGVIIASIPNVRHYTTVINLLLRGYWPYRERGIHDKNHVRFFTLRNIKELFQNADLSIIKLERNYRIIERPHRFNRFSRYFALSFLKDFLTFQYRIVAKKSKQSGIIFTVKTEEADFSRNEIGTKSKE